MPRTLYKDPKIKITYYPGNEIEHVLDALGYDGRWHHYNLREGMLAKIASLSDPCEVRRVLDRRCKHILTIVIGNGTSAPRVSEILWQAYHKQEALLAREQSRG